MDTTPHQVFVVGDKIYKIIRDVTESHCVYMKRCAFIINKIKTCDYDEAYRLSLIWRNSKIYGMVYPPAVMKLLE